MRIDHLTHFVSQYGYWAVAAGCLLEGETVMVLAGLAARRGLLDLPLVMALGSAMGALGDITMFSLGRWRGAAVLARWPRLLGYQERLNRLLAGWGAGVVVGLRFMYGMRIAGPILLGMSDLPWPRFLAFKLLGAALWGLGVAGAGWLFGHAAEALLGEVHDAEKWIVLALVALLGGVALWRWWRHRA